MQPPCREGARYKGWDCLFEAPEPPPPHFRVDPSANYTWDRCVGDHLGRRVKTKEKKGFLRVWVASQVATAVFRPRPEVLAAIEKRGLLPRLPSARNGSSSAPPAISMHVRRGDACDFFTTKDGVGKDPSTKKRPCYPLSKYMKAAKLFQKEYGVRDVFLATDSAEVVEESKSYPDFTFHYSAMDRAMFEPPPRPWVLLSHPSLILA